MTTVVNFIKPFSLQPTMEKIS